MLHSLKKFYYKARPGYATKGLGGPLNTEGYKVNKLPRLWNKCKRCECVTRGIVRVWPNKKQYWECPRCWHAQGYSS